uniref:ATP synthase complex subunit 8 n=1 Tax=Camptonotus carolinensis TaxID=114793 RepID=A0A0N6WAE3_9ORTH|nr:ATP synthase F0 subunit 8 [Camptonotus carolinensis]AJW76333.1 ATP synthase F0 subunit 8 [Camptonotus carolinensis]
MPQMAPISWVTLFFMFSTTLILFSTLNYFYSNTYPKSSLKPSLSYPSMTWKW